MSHLSSFPPVTSGAPVSTTQALPPQLPSHIEVWSTRALSAWLDVSTSTVKYHARQAFRGHNGRWELNREQAQRVVNRIFQFGQVRTLNKTSENKNAEVESAEVVGSDSRCKAAQSPELQKIERQLNDY